MLFTPEYIALNRELHERNIGYGTSGVKWARSVLFLAMKCDASTVLDYGCGLGTLKLNLMESFAGNVGYGEDGMPYAIPGPPFDVLEYDPAIPGKETKPDAADVVVCSDVLEHIEPDCLDDVLDDITKIARKAVFLVIATRPAKKILADGRNAHLIVRPAAWWLSNQQLLWRWNMTKFSNLGGEFLFEGMAK